MNKKVIIWTSVSVLVIGGAIGGYLWWQNRPESNGEEDTDEGDDDEFKTQDTNTGGGNTGGGYTSGGSTGGGTTTTSPIIPLTSFGSLKKYFGNSAKDYGTKIVITARGNNWGLNPYNNTAYVTFYKRGEFFVRLAEMESWVVKGKYYRGGNKLIVTDAKGNWVRNKGRVAELGNPVANVKLVMTT